MAFRGIRGITGVMRVTFYLDFFRYNCPLHGGFGLEIDRLTMLLPGMGIKDGMFLCRSPNRLTQKQ